MKLCFPNKISLLRLFFVFFKNNIDFIYSVVKIMNFNRAERTCYITKFPYASSGNSIAAVLYLSYSQDLILELGRDFKIDLVPSQT